MVTGGPATPPLGARRPVGLKPLRTSVLFHVEPASGPTLPTPPTARRLRPSVKEAKWPRERDGRLRARSYGSPVASCADDVDDRIGHCDSARSGPHPRTGQGAGDFGARGGRWLRRALAEATLEPRAGPSRAVDGPLAGTCPFTTPARTLSNDWAAPPAWGKGHEGARAPTMLPGDAQSEEAVTRSAPRRRPAGR